MSNLIPSPSLDNVPQLERTTVALGGPGAPMNTQAQALLNRSAYILNEISGFSGDISALQASVTSLNTNVSTINGQITTINGQISTLQGQVTTLQGQTSTNTSNISSNTTSISAINGGLGVVSGVTQPYTGSTTNTYNVKALDELSAIDFTGFVGNGTNDDTPAITAAISASVLSNKKLIARGFTIRLTSTINLPTALNADFSGSVFVADPAITSGYAVTVGGPDSASSGVFEGNIHGLVLLRALTSGHANTSSNVDGIGFGASNPNTAAGVNFFGLKVFGFRDNVSFTGPNTYILRFFGTQIAQCWRRNLAAYATSNSGENISFFGGVIANANNTSFNGMGVYIDPSTTGIELNFHGVSFDYNDISMQMNGGFIRCFGCHFENNNNNAHVQMIPQSGKTKPGLYLSGGQMGGGPFSVSWTGIPVENASGRPSMITCAAGSNDITVDGTFVSESRTGDTVTELVSATSGAYLRRMDLRPVIDASTSAAPFNIGFQLNSLYVSTSALTGWTQNGSTGATLSFDNTTFYSPDVGSRKVVGASGNSCSFTQTIPVRANQTFVAKAQINISSISNGYVTNRVDFIAQDGSTTVSSTAGATVTTATSGSWVTVWIFAQVPSGAVTAKVYDYFNSFTGTAWMSNEHVWIF